jgi:phospholipase A1
MKSIAAACALTLLTWQWANAASDNPKWQPCIEMQDKAPAQSELDCFRQVAQEAKLAGDKQKSLLPLRAPWLTQEWAPSNDPLSIYKQNYVLVYSKTTPTNDQPTSPNPQNQVLTAAPLDDRSLKFQFSIKHDLADFGRYGSLWLGYTQLSFWQLYDATRSRPFRENNYEPEFIYSIRPNDLIAPTGIFPSIINFGLVHQSNGQSNPMSRSWNRVYVQTGTEHNYGSEHRLVVLLRLWHRVDEDALTDDNPDITHYMGHGDIELRYSQSRLWEASLIARERSVQLDFSAPWTAWRLLTLASPGEHNTNLHLQYFKGYGESLIDYNQEHETWGIGLSFPFD